MHMFIIHSIGLGAGWTFICKDSFNCFTLPQTEGQLKISGDCAGVVYDMSYLVKQLHGNWEKPSALW